jgi:hypothetical protein
MAAAPSLGAVSGRELPGEDLAQDPKKREPIFGKDHAQAKC